MWDANLSLLREKLKVFCSLLIVSRHIVVRVHDEIFVSASLTCFSILFFPEWNIHSASLGFSEEIVLYVTVDKLCPCEEKSLGSH